MNHERVITEPLAVMSRNEHLFKNSYWKLIFHLCAENGIDRYVYLKNDIPSSDVMLYLCAIFDRYLPNEPLWFTDLKKFDYHMIGVPSKKKAIFDDNNISREFFATYFFLCLCTDLFDCGKTNFHKTLFFRRQFFLRIAPCIIPNYNFAMKKNIYYRPPSEDIRDYIERSLNNFAQEFALKENVELRFACEVDGAFICLDKFAKDFFHEILFCDVLMAYFFDMKYSPFLCCCGCDGDSVFVSINK